MQSNETKSRRRAVVTAGTAASLVVSLVGGTLTLLFSDGPQQSTTALKPLQPTVSAPIESEPSPSVAGETDLSMFVKPRVRLARKLERVSVPRHPPETRHA
ncbi:hypothetical protein MCEMAEM6B_01414 [Mycobacteriaceae bacterium]